MCLGSASTNVDFLKRVKETIRACRDPIRPPPGVQKWILLVNTSYETQSRVNSEDCLEALVSSLNV